jgi:hypothetical protein
VGFYAASSCPSGYSAYEAARGRSLVGLPAGGRLEAPVGTALSPEENRPVGGTNAPYIELLVCGKD